MTLTQRDNTQRLTRFITRFMFVWFLKQNAIIPAWLFDKKEMTHVLNKTFDPHSQTDGVYYNGVVQNLFFATLNKDASARAFTNDAKSRQNHDYGVKPLYRDHKGESLFGISHDAFVTLFKSVPFLNSGLFDCLDSMTGGITQRYIDGFSREKSRAACMPNALFWGDGVHEGVIPLFSRYDFTLDEFSSRDNPRVLTPRILGKALETFDHAACCPPPELVERITDATLKAYLEQTLRRHGAYITNEQLNALFYNDVPQIIPEKQPASISIPQIIPEKQRASITEPHTVPEKQPAVIIGTQAFTEKQCALIINAVHHCTIIDPACGTGDVLLSALHKRMSLLDTLSPDSASAYNRKLSIIEHGLFGIDAQPFALEICTLRFFLSLLADQSVNTTHDNWGIRTLPNLETRFVAANSIAHHETLRPLSDIPLITIKQRQLRENLHRYFHAITAQEKMLLRHSSQRLRADISALQELYPKSTPSPLPPPPHHNYESFDVVTGFGFRAMRSPASSRVTITAKRTEYVKNF
ncbi:MAG: hypothetical protein LBS86_06085 [Treponema sp.]|nr:hypothetical protein [Treponema sp.]